MKPETSDLPQVTSHIQGHDESGNLVILVINAPGIGTFGWNVQKMSPKDRDWIKGVAEKQFREAIQNAYKLGQKSVRDPIKKALGMPLQ